ncbi:MAG: alpha-N-acetylglucosaminidase C-terminal domain-containing protein [Bacteroidaceae bacterium]|nr:alpha-N-acetylglucosaminidase C-terminal domain-containing protein [Bacteroidaceae bacterium]
MKKNFLLTLVLGLLCITTGWAQFAPEEGKMYALKETTSGLYLDIQTGVKDGNNCYDDNLSLSANPCVIYFAAGTTDASKWTMKNVNGEYVMQGSQHWIVRLGETAYEWTIAEPEAGKFTIARADGKFIGADNTTAGVCLYCDRGTGLKFSLVELSEDPYVLLKTSSGTYLSTTSVANDTHLSIQAEGTKFVLETSQDGNAYYIKVLGSSPAQYVSTYSGNAWGSSTSETPYAWSFSDPDENGYVTISRVGAPTYCLGTTFTPNAGIAVYSNAGSESGTPNKWLIEEYNVGAVGYTFQITNPSGETVSATYKGNAVSAGEIIEIEGPVDKSLFDATDVEGYAWSVVVNSSAKTITIVYVEKFNGSYYLKTSSGTYLNFTPHASLSTSVTFQTTGSELYIEPSGDNYYITQLNSTPVKYLTVSSSNAWDVAASTAAFAWSISNPDANGYVTITKASNSDHRLGNDGNTNAGTGVFANVGANCNTWQLVKVGPLDYTFAINNPTGEIVSATYNGNAIAAGGTISIDGRVDTSLFSANEIEGYSWNVELDPDTRTITLVYEKKYNWSIVGLPDGATITYNSAAVTDGGIVGVDYDSQHLAVTCPNGYTWAVTRDDENKIVTITFTQLQSAENPQAVVDLLNRIGGAGTADRFKIVLDPSLNYTAEQFSINGEDGKILIKGTTISAITTGIGWYLQNHAHINIAWNSLNEKTVDGGAYADLSNIPVPTAEEIHTSDAMYRYYLNTCAFGYSMTSWTWKRWQQEIDWMALHGINMPLQLVGMEEVWRKFLTMKDGSGNRKYGYSDADAKAFVAGPAFIAWWAMNNLQGWGGTAAGTKSGGTWDGAGGVQDDAWYVRQKNLAKLICDRQRELGMQPVIPGWSGMVPTNFASKSGYTTRGNGGNWAGDFVRPLLLSASNANYAEIAADYYTCLHEVMGESQYYSMDPFHEGGGAGTMEDYEAMYAAMEAAKPGSQWVIQQWQWSSTQRYSLTAVPAGRLVVLDLFADGSPAFDSYNGYAPQDAVFSTIPNFGGRSGLMGRLTNLTDNYFKFKAKYSSIKGIGAAPEAIEQTPVTYDLIFQLPWMNGVKPDVAEWVSNYSIARYGVENEEIKEAWSLLRQGPLNYGADAIQGPVEDVWAARPNLDANHASYWGKTLANAQGTYTKARQQMLIDATYKLLDQSGAVTMGTIYESNLNYDLVEFGGGVLADYAYYLLLGIKEAKTAAGANFATDATYIARRDAFLQLILDVDAFKGTNLNFRLGKWTQEARAAAGEVTGATTATADWYEYNNARTIVSTWSSPNTNLNDYSYRSWQGLMKDLYYPRWKHYFDNNCTSAQYGFFEWNWAHGLVHEVGQTAVSTTALTSSQQGHTDKYTREPEGNTVDVAKEVLGKYIIPVKLADGSTYYAYRCLSSDLNLTLNTTEGATLDLSEYITFSNTDGVTMSITSSLIDGTSTDLSAVTIKANACGDADSATDVVTVALSDGTSLTLTVVVETSELVAAKENLAALIEEMEELAAQVGTYNPVGVLNEVTLTTTSGNNGYIWTNAQSSKEGPIAGLIDTDLSTYLHTDYTSSVTSGTHYIAVDLGADYELGKFTIDYTTRSGASADFPDGIVVYGSDTNGDDYVKIAEITEPTFPQSENKKWELGKNLYSNKRYLRFNVLAERGYWHMADFNIYKTASTAEVVNKYSSVIKNEFAATQYDVLVDAKNTYDYGETTQETNDAVTALQAAIDALKEKMALVEVPTGGPFEYTTDESNPVLYNILINRDDEQGNDKVLQFDEESKKVAVKEKVENNSYQAWYFMNGTKGFRMIPYNGMGKVLSAESSNAEKETVSAQTIGDQTYYEWILTEPDNNGYYYIQVHDGGNTYFSNNGGVDFMMGFWTAKDEGSQFKFVPATFSNDNPRYYQLKDVTAAMDVTKQAMSGDAPGCRENGDEHYNSYTAAMEQINKGSDVAAAADCYTVYTTLRATREALGDMIMPTPGNVYRLKNHISKSAEEGHKNHYIANSNAKLSFPTEADDNTTLWICVEGADGKFQFISGVGSATLTWKNFGENAVDYEIRSGVEQGAVALAYGTDNLTLTNEENANGVLFGHIANNATEQDNTWSTDWYIEPVADDVKAFHSRSIAKGYNYATLYLPYAATVPDGISAYTATVSNVAEEATRRYVDLQEVENGIIPARTAVVLYREGEAPSLQEYKFGYTTDEGTAAVNNIFDGRVMTSAVGGDKENYCYYLLFRGTKGEAFYWMLEEYNESLGSGNTHIKCEGNKAYMVLPKQQNNASSYSFRFPGTTGVEELEGENGKVEGVYDLQGRKVTEISESGIYIVNGEKSFIK